MGAALGTDHLRRDKVLGELSADGVITLARSSDEADLLHTVRGDRLVNAQVHGRLAPRTDRTTSLSNPDSRGTALVR